MKRFFIFAFLSFARGECKSANAFLAANPQYKVIIEGAPPSNGTKNAAGFQGEAIASIYNGEKVYFKRTERRDKKFQLFDNEVGMYKKLADVEGLPRFYGCVISPKNLFMIVGDRGEVLKTFSSPFYELSLCERFGAMHQLAKIVDDLHKSGIVHNDLHKGNVAYNAKTGEIGLLDLGIACLSGARPLLRNVSCVQPTHFTSARRRTCAFADDVWAFFLLLGTALADKPENSVSTLFSHRCYKQNGVENCVKLIQNIIRRTISNVSLQEFVVNGLALNAANRPKNMEIIAKKMLKIIAECEFCKNEILRKKPLNFSQKLKRFFKPKNQRKKQKLIEKSQIESDESVIRTRFI